MKPETRNAVIAWSVSPISFIALGLLVLWIGSLSPLSTFITFLYVFAYAFVTARFFRVFYRSDIAQQKPWIQFALLSSIFVPVTYIASRQFSPIRILQSQSPGGVFSEFWYSLDQVAYGYPSPIVRFFDTADSIYGDKLIDWVSLLLTIWVAILFIFLLLATFAIILKLTTKKGEQVGDGDAEEAV